MKTATITDFRQNMKRHLQLIQQDHDFLVLTGPKGKSFVVMTLEEYNSMEETAYLMSTPANAIHLLESIAQARAGKATVRDLDLDNLPLSPNKRKKKKKAGK